MSHVYTITLQDKRTVMHVEAKSAHEAKRVALEGVEVKRLNGSEILDLTRRGIAIVSAATGAVNVEDMVGFFPVAQCLDPAAADTGDA